MTIPPHISRLSDAVNEFIRRALDHSDYLKHGSPQSSVDAALERSKAAEFAMRLALEDAARLEGVA